MARTRTSLAAAITGMALLTVPQAPAWAASEVARGNGGLSAKAAIDFTIVVPRVMRMQLLAHPATIAVGPEDIARGSIKVSGAHLDLLVNDRLGYAIHAEVVHPAFSAARITGLSSAAVATSAGAVIPMPSMVGKPRPAPMPVEYELQLSPDAQPGTYAWPVSLSLHQL
jgi:hypothetical protein